MPLDRTNPNDFYHKGHKEYLKFRWNETSSKEFLEKAKTGVHENAELISERN